MSADTTVGLSADTADVLSANTTDVLPADTFPSENPPSRICQIWHLKNEIWSPFGHIRRSPSHFCRSRTNFLRRRQLWGCWDMGVSLFLGDQESGGAPCSQKILALDFGMGGGRGLGLAKNPISFGFPERFPTFMGLACPKEERMGPPGVAKIELYGKWAEIEVSHFARISRAYKGDQAYCPGLGAYTTPDTPAQGGPVC